MDPKPEDIVAVLAGNQTVGEPGAPVTGHLWHEYWKEVGRWAPWLGMAVGRAPTPNPAAITGGAGGSLQYPTAIPNSATDLILSNRGAMRSADNPITTLSNSPGASPLDLDFPGNMNFPLRPATNPNPALWPSSQARFNQAMENLAKEGARPVKSATNPTPMSLEAITQMLRTIEGKTPPANQQTGPFTPSP